MKKVSAINPFFKDISTHQEFCNQYIFTLYIAFPDTSTTTVPFIWDRCCAVILRQSCEQTGSCPDTSLILMSCLSWNSSCSTEVTCICKGEADDREQLLALSVQCCIPVFVHLCWGSFKTALFIIFISDNPSKWYTEKCSQIQWKAWDWCTECLHYLYCSLMLHDF